MELHMVSSYVYNVDFICTKISGHLLQVLACKKGPNLSLSKSLAQASSGTPILASLL